MYLSRLHLQNWRSYGDAAFDFNEPTSRRSVVLIGAMNGHGKTSLLVSLYLGLFGRFGLRYCEGFSRADEDDVASYRQAIERYRRNYADPEEPTMIDITSSTSARRTTRNGSALNCKKSWRAWEAPLGPMLPNWKQNAPGSKTSSTKQKKPLPKT
jgi:DNA sulfur modification protein DndD